MAYRSVNANPYAGVIDHTTTTHNGAVSPAISALNSHSHDPGDVNSGNNVGGTIPAWGSSNILYPAHGPGASGTDWITNYYGTAAIPADPSETAVSPLSGLIVSQAAPPTSITAAHGIQAHLQRLYGALALLKAASATLNTTVQVSPAPTTTTFSVPPAVANQVQSGVSIVVGAQTVTVAQGGVNVSTGVITIVGTMSVAVAGQTVTQRTGNWWDNVQVALLGNTPMSGNINVSSSNTITAGVFVSTAGSGTSPMTIASPTKVTNLNADMVDGFSAWPTATGSAGGLMPAPTSGPTNLQLVAGGTLSVAVQRFYKQTFVVGGAETVASPASGGATPTSGNQSISMALLVGPGNVTARKLYRSDTGVGGIYGLVKTQNDNTTTTVTDTGTALGAAPPAVGTAKFSSIIPVLNGNGYLAPGYIEYDSAEATTWDTLVSGTSTIINTMNRIRNQVTALLTAAGGSWGTAPSSLVTTVGGVGGAVGLVGAGGITFSVVGQNITMTGATGKNNIWTGTNAFNGQVSLGDGINVAVGGTTGTQFGTSGTQKMGWWGVTPVTRPTVTGSRASGVALTNLLSALASTGIIVDNSTA